VITVGLEIAAGSIAMGLGGYLAARSDLIPLAAAAAAFGIARAISGNRFR
jgi:hypothetical protein